MPYRVACVVQRQSLGCLCFNIKEQLQMSFVLFFCFFVCFALFCFFFLIMDEKRGVKLSRDVVMELVFRPV